jgi:hypothetical protein
MDFTLDKQKLQEDCRHQAIPQRVDLKSKREIQGSRQRT